MSVTPLVFTLDDGTEYQTTRYEFRPERERREHEAARPPFSDSWFLVGRDKVRPTPVEYVVHVRPSDLAAAEDELAALRDAAERARLVSWGPDHVRPVAAVASVRVSQRLLGYRVRVGFWLETTEMLVPLLANNGDTLLSEAGEPLLVQGD